MKPVLIRASDRAAMAEESFTHPLNPKSLIHGVSLGDATGLRRIGFHVARVPKGKESFVRHSHLLEEEFIFVLSGRGIAEIDDEQHEVGPGDFLGFPTPSVAHHMKNPFDEDLVYISGGERREAEIAEFPTLGKRMIRLGGKVSIHAIATEEAFAGLPLLSKGK
jgi:uncharacterized cupin superfamily protein